MFQIGDRVFLASGSPKQVWVACPDCLGEGRVKIILGGVEHWIDCCCCERGLESPGRIMTYEYNGDVQEIVIGGVESSQSNDGLEVRYRFNVTPHSWNSVDADKVFSNREDATIKAAELAVHSNREADENLQRKSNMKKSWAWNASYHRREIERAKKDLEYHTKKLNVASVRAKESE